ncbi:MAG: tRNA-dihydrouridine synthase [Actinomycetota bacterium]
MKPLAMKPLKIGNIELASPIVLAPMAGVTNAPFRTLCREFASGLMYVNEMVMATALRWFTAVPKLNAW